MACWPRGGQETGFLCWRERSLDSYGGVSLSSLLCKPLGERRPPHSLQTDASSVPWIHTLLKQTLQHQLLKQELSFLLHWKNPDGVSFYRWSGHARVGHTQHQSLEPQLSRKWGCGWHGDDSASHWGQKSRVMASLPLGRGICAHYFFFSRYVLSLSRKWACPSMNL